MIESRTLWSGINKLKTKILIGLALLKINDFDFLGGFLVFNATFSYSLYHGDQF
jgi:hypothetical protein